MGGWEYAVLEVVICAGWKGLFHQSKLRRGIEEVNVPSKLLASEDRLVGLPGNG